MVEPDARGWYVATMPFDARSGGCQGGHTVIGGVAERHFHGRKSGAKFDAALES